MGESKPEELLAANPPKSRTTVKRFALDLKARIASAAAAFRRGHGANPDIDDAAFAPGIEYVLGIVDAALSDYDVRDPEDYLGRTPSAVLPSEPTGAACTACNGRGEVGGLTRDGWESERCSTCGGTGRTPASTGKAPCSDCGGQGKRIKETANVILQDSDWIPCRTCRGASTGKGGEG